MRWIELHIEQVAAKHNLTETEKDLLIFSASRIYSLVFIVFFVLIGTFFGSTLESIFYLLSFWTLRVFVGGYHAGSNARCLVLSALVSLPVLIINVITLYWLLPFVYILSFSLTYLYAPKLPPTWEVADPLAVKHMSCKIVVFQAVLCALLYYAGLRTSAISLGYGSLVASVFLLL